VDLKSRAEWPLPEEAKGKDVHSAKQHLRLLAQELCEETREIMRALSQAPSDASINNFAARVWEMQYWLSVCRASEARKTLIRRMEERLANKEALLEKLRGAEGSSPALSSPAP
jgi:hypothetical protein